MAEEYGPLQGLIGSWKGDRGIDVAPEPDDTSRTPFWETIDFEGIGDVENAEKQTLMIVRYHQQVYKKENDEQFHDQLGYLTWDAATGDITHTFIIPRGVGVVAMGKAAVADDGTVTIDLGCDLENPDGGITQAPFMRDNAKTVSFKQTITLSGDELGYEERTGLYIYGRDFDHVDKSKLSRQ